MKKKLVSMLILVVMICSMLPMAAFADPTEPGFDTASFWSGLQVGTAFSNKFGATDTDAGELEYSVTGSFVPGLSLAADGSVSGTPTTAGDYEFTVTVRNVDTGKVGQYKFVSDEAGAITVAEDPNAAVTPDKPSTDPSYDPNVPSSTTPSFTVTAKSPIGDVDLVCSSPYYDNLCSAVKYYAEKAIADPTDDTFKYYRDPKTPNEVHLYVQLVISALPMNDARADYYAAREYVENVLGSKWSIGALYDISCIVYDADGHVRFEMPYISEDVQLELRLPSALKASGREYKVISVHNTNGNKYNGKSTQDVTTGYTSNWVYFAADGFSTYAIAVKGGNFNIPATGDESNMVLWVSLMTVSAMAAAAYLFYRKRENIG